MANRIVTEEYTAGAHAAVEFLKSWADRDVVAPWDMVDQFMSRQTKMPQQQYRGFRHAVFLYLQWTLDGTSPDLDNDNWLMDLENPQRYFEETVHD
ncbi:hypothetical protein F3J20_16130 [Paraburkholderia sp. Cy-641]|uniref:hypothetical protein n=1 Tax=Paraburkholderia sp. Cy-641 TaxID=2608337 RepID=UPI0014203AC1|nr:hypothetical protein [Paraburkholderia sp. Cy-641]NIF78896.1 hypothetical protein [Paraburkholderia sp. Cy-641]